MNSTLKAASNRRNAKKSTGPTSGAGKATSALNALKHGFSGRLGCDAETREKVDALAKAFTGGEKDAPQAIALARKAAEFQVMALRLKEARRRAWADARIAAPTPDGDAAADIELVSGRLAKLVRYERHAANMRDKALRDLERARAPTGR